MVVETRLPEIPYSFYPEKNYLVVQETEMDRTVRHLKHQQRSSISILRISQQQQLVVRLQVRQTVGGGSAALTTAASAASALSARAAPTITARAIAMVFLRRSAFTDPQISQSQNPAAVCSGVETGSQNVKNLK